MKKFIKFFILLTFLIIFSTYTPKFNLQYDSFIFPIKNIKIENNKILSQDTLVKSLQFLKHQSLVFINETSVEKKLLKYDFVSSFKIKKIYPDTIQITIYEKEPVAIHIDSVNKFYISINGDRIKYLEHKNYKNLPLIFGKNINFSEFYKSLVNLKFPINSIRSFHYFDINRWDITLKNKKVIKLPSNDYVKSIENFIEIVDKKAFLKYKIFDYRINNQLILN